MFFSHPLETRLIAEPRIENDGVDARALAELTKSIVVVTSSLLNSKVKVDVMEWDKMNWFVIL